MIIRLKDDFKKENGGYWKANDVRVDTINKNKNSKFLNEITKQLFATNDTDLMKQLLEDDLFYEKILIGDVEQFQNAIQHKELKVEDFIKEYNFVGCHGFIGVCKMLSIF
ncbi:hypothetical protein TPDSL_17720 [Terrisporobacter petrolearius]|uniref:hypothetical protein n=1 Tax=Terrisporobacter petrolearius TaxID=1460447 RepID=UPI0033673B29